MRDRGEQKNRRKFCFFLGQKEKEKRMLAGAMYALESARREVWRKIWVGCLKKCTSMLASRKERSIKVF